MVWICRPDGSLDFLNARGRAFFGSGLPDALELFPSGALLHGDDQAPSRELWQRALRDCQPFCFEARLLRDDGRSLWHRVNVAPMQNERGQVLKWLGTSTDVHEVKEGNELNAFLLQLATDFAHLHDPHELLYTGMGRLRERLGAAWVILAEIDEPPQEACMLRLGRDERANLQVENISLAGFEHLLTEAKQGVISVVADYGQQPHGARDQRWFGLELGAVISAPLLHRDALVALLSVVDSAPRDWTSAEIEVTRRVAQLVWPALEKARAERELALSEQRLRLAQAVAQIGTWELDPATRSLILSPESYELFGLAPDEREPYLAWTQLIDSRDVQALQVLIEECHAKGAGETEYRYRHPKRGLRWIYCRAGMVQDSGRPYIVAVSLDVTTRRQAEEALKEVNRRKDEFLAMLAHELRNPLAPIRNAAQILRTHSAERPELEWARTVIERQTHHLARLVDDLLDVSRTVRGLIVLQKTSVALAELVQLAVETSRPLIRARGHELHLQLPADDVRIEGDLTRLAQVLGNLLNNAAKYTEPGGHVWLHGLLEQGQIVLRVRDSGPGISPALLPHVFDLFAQAERPLDRAQGGLGIGLTLVKLLVEMHAGSVEACNLQPGPGAQFTVRLPAQLARVTQPEGGAAPQSAADSAAAGLDRSMRVLVVDDNVDAADSIALLLSIEGFETQSVHTATAALETVGSFKPDVLLLDIGLPEMDGYEVTRRLRARIPLQQMRIVALSGYGQPSDRERAAQAGFDEYLVKPVDPGRLSEFLRSLR